tara:strand:+ start:150 stop:800 length:651 start_codon:yes stop_codon:yes gene_type:complete
MIIGICGLIGSGKGTVADILVDEHFKKISFADKLKDGVSTVFGWDRQKLEGDTDDSREWRELEDKFWTNETGRKITPRLVLQLFGTDCMRDGFDNGIWVSLVKKKLLENPNTDFVIPDVRFENEIKMIKEVGGKVWVVIRGQTPNWLIEYQRHDIIPPKNIHSSEYRWVKEKKDVVIDNNGSIEELRDQVLSHLDPNRSLQPPDNNLDIQFSDYGC